jgi:predicted small metal-binding protein
MKSLSCKDLGAVTCPFVATGETDDEVVQKMVTHAALIHPEDVAKMKAMPEGSMEIMMKSKIKEV